MASSSSFRFLLFCSLLFPSISLSTAKTASFSPKALVLPVTKDASTSQYLVQIKQRTPLVPVKLTVEFGGESLWVDCTEGFVSSTYKPAPCGSAQCNLAEVHGCSACAVPVQPGCYNNTCDILAYNPFLRQNTFGAFSSDVVSLQSTNGFNPGRAVSVPKFPFTCGYTDFLKGLALGVKGIAGLGRKKTGLPSLFASALSFNRKFAVCLSSSASSKGVIFFGNEPYVFLPNIDVSKNLIYTPLIFNPVSTSMSWFKGETSADYFIGVTSIKINDKVVPINTTLLSIDKSTGIGGTKISTVERYTVMHTSIYNAVVNAFVNALPKVPRLKAVAPFGACYSSKSFGSTRVGPAVPQIDLVLHNNNVVWSIFGANSMVQVSNDVLCLGFVDGGVELMTSVVIGGHQIEDNLLQVDLASSRLGFSSSLLFRQTTCANFNFTSIA